MSPSAVNVLAGTAWVASIVLVLGDLFFAVLARSYTGVTQPLLFRVLLWLPALLAFPTVGALVARRRPEHTIGWLFLVIGLLNGLAGFAEGYGTYALALAPGSLPAGELAEWLPGWLYTLGTGSVLAALLVFPDGRLPSPRWWPAAGLLILGLLLTAFGQAFKAGVLPVGLPIQNPLAINELQGTLEVVLALGGACAVLGMLGAVAALVVRLRRAVGVERQQLKWFVYAGAIAGLGFVSSLVLRPWPELGTLAMGVGFLGFGLTAIAAGIAVLRYRLYDIDLLINRTLVYAVLTACVVGIYVLVVTYFGAAFQARGDAVSLLAAGVVAVLFQPLRDRLQRGVNRLLYGQRDDPYGVLSRLGQRLESTLAPDAVLSTIVQTVRDALKLTYTAIALEQDGASALVAASGMRQGLLVELPLVYQAEPLGHLLLGPRAPGELFSPADRRLLDDLARQAGVAVHAVRLTADLQRARERLVTGREEERRRLRRDLHDGLGSQLAGLNIHAGVLRKLIAHDTAGAEAAAAELQAELRAAIASIRRLVRDLRPQAVDELGLIGAVRVRAAQYAEAELRIAVDAPEQLGPLPAAVEVATYRIVEEALTNAVRHAHAQNCDVRLTLADGALNLVIKDDGVGLTPGGTVGVGLLSMRERAMELGGTCLVRTGTHGGTEVLVRLPLPEE